MGMDGLGVRKLAVLIGQNCQMASSAAVAAVDSFAARGNFHATHEEGRGTS
jgi:hypothetical protein